MDSLVSHRELLLHPVDLIVAECEIHCSVDLALRSWAGVWVSTGLRADLLGE
jgi:hypothetical protein